MTSGRRWFSPYLLPNSYPGEHSFILGMAIDYLWNSQRTTPKEINPAKPALPNSLTKAVMLPTTSPRKDMLPGPTNREATMASARRPMPISVRELIVFFMLSYILFSSFWPIRSVIESHFFCNSIVINLAIFRLVKKIQYIGHKMWCCAQLNYQYIESHEIKILKKIIFRIYFQFYFHSL